MNGNVNPPPGGPADGFDAPAQRPRGLQARAGFYPAAPAALGNGRAPWPSRRRADMRTRHARARRRGRLKSPIDLRSPTMPRSTASAAATNPPATKQALAELERWCRRMEGGQLPLDQLLDSYRRGAELLRFCRARLQAVEQQVKVLEDGQLKPWTPHDARPTHLQRDAQPTSTAWVARARAARAGARPMRCDRALGAGRRARRPGRGHALRRARRRQAPAPAAGAGGLRGRAAASARRRCVPRWRSS